MDSNKETPNSGFIKSFPVSVMRLRGLLGIGSLLLDLPRSLAVCGLGFLEFQAGQLLLRLLDVLRFTVSHRPTKCYTKLSTMTPAERLPSSSEPPG